MDTLDLKTQTDPQLRDDSIKVNFWRFTTLGALDLFALSLWLGGLLIIGAVVAPVAFTVIRANPAFAGEPSLQSQLAGSIVGGSLRIFNYITYACGPIMAAINLRRRCSARAIIAIVLTVISLLLGFVTFPALDQAQAAGDMARFDSLHVLYVNMSYVQMALLLIYLVLTARPPKRMAL